MLYYCIFFHCNPAMMPAGTTSCHCQKKALFQPAAAAPACSASFSPPSTFPCNLKIRLATAISVQHRHTYSGEPAFSVALHALTTSSNQLDLVLLGTNLVATASTGTDTHLSCQVWPYILRGRSCRHQSISGWQLATGSTVLILVG